MSDSAKDALKALAKGVVGLGCVEIATKSREDGNDVDAFFFGAIGLAVLGSLAKQVLEEEAKRLDQLQAENDRQAEAEQKRKDEERERFKKEHVCRDCGGYFDKLYSDGLCYSDWNRRDIDQDED